MVHGNLWKYPPTNVRIIKRDNERWHACNVIEEVVLDIIQHFSEKQFTPCITICC